MAEKITIKQASSVPSSEVSADFLQGMADRMGVSYFKYGRVADASKQKVDFIKSLRKRIDKYESTGNTEWLMDVANFAMIEFMFPAHPKAHFRATDSHESPGKYIKGEVNATHRRNTEY